MTSGGEAVAGLLRVLDARLRPATRASWIAVDGVHEATGAPLAPEVADLLPGLAELLRREAGLFAAGGGRVTFEVGGRTVLVHALGADGMVVIDARAGLNLALVRHHVEAVIAEHSARLSADAPPPEQRPLPVRRSAPAAGGDPAAPGDPGDPDRLDDALGRATAPEAGCPTVPPGAVGVTGEAARAGAGAPAPVGVGDGPQDADVAIVPAGSGPPARRGSWLPPVRRARVPRQRTEVAVDSTDGPTLGRVLAALLDHEP